VTVAFLVLTGLAAVADWWAVAKESHRAELVLKPLTLVLLLVAAAFADLGDAKPWVFAALALGLMGDVALMFSTDERSGSDDLDPFFLAGLGSFLLGHVAYIVAFAQHGVHGLQTLAGVFVVGGATVLALPRVLRGARETGGSLLAAIVGVYAGLLATMTVLSFGTAAICTAIGGALFLASDITLAWNRFVQALLRGPLIVIVTYHLAQILIVIGLIR
jgi:uncharacterized membrane protein YhhN